MRNDDALLLDMLIAARKIQRFTDDFDKSAFKGSELVQSAVMREFQVIGEVARMLTDETKNKHSQLPWRAIIGMRNRMIHEYFNVDLDVVWETIDHDLPSLVTLLEAIVPPET
jgi:uncharacterized protein with HEPN domain